MARKSTLPFRTNYQANLLDNTEYTNQNRAKRLGKYLGDIFPKAHHSFLVSCASSCYYCFYLFFQSPLFY